MSATTTPPPDGFTVRHINPASRATRRRRSITDVGRHVLEEAARRHGLGWGPLSSPSGPEPVALAARGALEIASRGGRRIYRLTATGARAIGYRAEVSR